MKFAVDIKGLRNGLPGTAVELVKAKARRERIKDPEQAILASGAEAACQGKVAHSTAAQAHRVMKKRRLEGQVYRCPFCHQFHTGRHKG